MPSSIIKFSLVTNNHDLEDYFFSKNNFDKLRFVKNKQTANYHLYLIDLTSQLVDVSRTLIEHYQYCRENNQKLTIVLLHGQKIDSEKNLYFIDTLHDLAQQKPLHRLLVVPCLFADNSTGVDLWFNRLINQSLHRHQISISKNGQTTLNPLFISDFEEIILKATFLSNTQGQIFWVFGNSTKDLDLAYLLQRHLYDLNKTKLDINSIEDKNQLQSYQNLGIETQIKLDWEPREQMESRLKVYLRLLIEQNDPIQNESDQIKRYSYFKKITSKFHYHAQKIQEIKPKKVIKKIIEEVLAVVILLYLGISIVFVYTVYSSLKTLETSFFYLRKGDIQTTSKNLTLSKNYLRIGEINYQFIAPVLNFISPDQNLKNQNLISFVNYTQNTIQSLLQTYSLAEKVYLSIGIEENKTNYEEVTIALKSNLQLTFENISQVEIILNKSNLPSFLEDSIKKNFEYNSIKAFQEQLNQLTKIVDLIPPTLDGQVGKNLVIVFQNSHEERSTGGVIESVLHLTLDNGKFISKKIYSSTAIDGLNTESIEAPPLIKDITGVDQWKTRDMNYNPDFPQTAVNLKWLIEKSLKFSPDIIIFLTDDLLTELIFSEADVSLDTQSIKSESFQDLLSKGEAQTIIPKIIDHFTDRLLNHQIKFIDLGKILAKAMGESQILFWTSDKDIEKSLLSQNYTGSVRERECHPGMQSARLCLSQTSHLSISNYALVPLNSYLKHEIKHIVYLDTDKIKHQYLVNYSYQKNTPLLNRNLVEIYQVYLPQGSILKSVLVDGQPVGLSNLFAQSEIGLDRYQFPIATTFNSPHQVIVDFDFSLSETVKLPIAYSFTEIRQFGSHSDGISLEINHPASIRASAITSEVTSKPGKILYQFPLKTATFAVHFLSNQI